MHERSNGFVNSRSLLLSRFLVRSRLYLGLVAWRMGGRSAARAWLVVELTTRSASEAFDGLYDEDLVCRLESFGGRSIPFQRSGFSTDRRHYWQLKAW